ncbi:hypothetical protein KP509_29G014800 [Ceratopteris richardii]|uniref:Uncharacterized protein n=1 Tax=Ceratopteris richardii TaxID=49495 RepID=A0A8T2R615_CERRI|nr:hypothetical protein KP509_29G014800 [Ceratopteris richardii]
MRSPLTCRGCFFGAVNNISYGALRADNSPCPPMSGCSYYLPNCRSATGSVNPYTRGCTTATRCYRDTA